MCVRGNGDCLRDFRVPRARIGGMGGIGTASGSADGICGFCDAFDRRGSRTEHG